MTGLMIACAMLSSEGTARGAREEKILAALSETEDLTALGGDEEDRYHD